MDISKASEGVMEKYGWIVKVLASKKAQDIISIDISEVSGFADIFFISNSNSESHMKALLDVITDALDERQITYVLEGRDSNLWRLIDCGDVIIHIFSQEGRKFYDLERIWGDVPILHYDEDGEPVAVLNANA
ncbi:ribosome silencing factor [Acetomicrobium hydrogeniformans]|uniref:Ribosomal silencing factor RsfS n=1 Tax=Acetomicrobium hydrogeniformans TaxID=649746 RepID=A0A7V7BYQ0_9BACT|nr:ribosome silencing factor [Acetomicrobium hydrogeniformans]HHZ04919.1 ribosome silencing factor [Acetomicrobium hydrogeniformans]